MDGPNNPSRHGKARATSKPKTKTPLAGRFAFREERLVEKLVS
jgi:hypothetical protein